MFPQYNCGRKQRKAIKEFGNNLKTLWKQRLTYMEGNEYIEEDEIRI